MKLFIVEQVLKDWTSGLVAIKAESLEQARDLFDERFEERDLAVYDGELLAQFDAAIKNGDYKVLELSVTDQMPAGIVQIVWGGG
jgi:hypothetical protein